VRRDHDGQLRRASVAYTKAGSSDTSQNLSYTWDANTAGAPGKPATHAQMSCMANVLSNANKVMP